MNGNILKPLREATKSLVFRYTKFGVPKYPYNIEPAELVLMVNEFDRLRATPGNIVEVGVARGMTTRFLCQHIVRENLGSTLKYHAVDTFSSFLPEHLEYEVKKRGKALFDLRGFGYNNYEVWCRNFAEFPFVNAVRADCTAVDYNQLGPLKLALLDVDLYVPTTLTLPKLYDALVPGGAILVDDVMNSTTYDGAYDAYMEFCEDQRIAPQVVGNKCGVIRKPR